MANLKLKNPAGGSLNLVSADGASDLTVTFPATTGTAMVSGNMPAFSAESTTGQSITSTTWTKVTLGSEIFDTNNNFSSSRFTATIAGYYQFNGCIRCGGTSLTGIIIGLYKNSTFYSYGNAQATSVSPDNSINVSEILSLAVGDYVELYGFIIGTSPSFAYALSGANARFSGSLVRAA